MPRSVNDKIPVVGHALTDGNVFDSLAWSDAIIRGVVGTLGGAIDVDDFNVVAIYAAHLLAATRGEADR